MEKLKILQKKIEGNKFWTFRLLVCLSQPIAYYKCDFRKICHTAFVSEEKHGGLIRSKCSRGGLGRRNI